MKQKIVRVADLREQVYEGLRERIVSGELKPGDTLTEMQVASEFGVSRTPSREALVMLTQSGLIQALGRSFQIPLFSTTDIKAIFEIRRLLEPYAVRSIIESHSPADLKLVCDQMRKLLSNAKSFKGYVRAHSDFRKALFGLLRNGRLQQLIATYNEQVQFIRMTTLINDDARRESLNGNLRFISCIADSQSDAAASELIKLIDIAEQLALSGTQATIALPGSLK